MNSSNKASPHLIEAENCKLISITPLNHFVHQITLQYRHTDRIHYFAGQYLELRIDGEAYPFSIASGPNAKSDDNGWQSLELHIGTPPGNKQSAHIIHHLKSKGPFEINLPKGECLLQGSTLKPILLIVASTGFSQAKAIIEECIHLQYKQPIHLYWGVRQPQDFYLTELLSHWQERLDSFQVHLSTSEPVATDETAYPLLKGISPESIRSGHIHHAVLEDFNDLSPFTAFICGSPTMVYSVLDDLEPRGLNPDATHSDVFEYMPRGAT